jgi:hypothetical protein
MLFQNLTNLYEVRKTVRFIAEPLAKQRSIIDDLKIDTKKNNDEKYLLLTNFLKDFEDILSKAKKVFFYENSGDLKEFFKIKYKFLQTHTKYDFYKVRDSKKIYSFSELEFIEDFLTNYFEKLEETKTNLDYFAFSAKEKQNRYREIGFYLQRLN